MISTRQWLLASHPRGRGLLATDWEMATRDVPEPAPGDMLLKIRWLGFDPAQKGWMENIADYVAPMALGDVMRGSGIAEVIRSNGGRYAVGDLLCGPTGWTEYLTSDGKEFIRVATGLPPTTALSILGTTGLTAYCGLFKLGLPIAGDTVVISGAAGATGSIVGQLAKIAGCRVVGIAGGADKCAWLVGELGFDAAIDYKAENVRARLKDVCPTGINVIFDNVGGKILNEMLARIATHARVVICGGISRYETGAMPAGPENYFNLVFRRATMRGFIVLDYAGDFPDIRRRMSDMITTGALRYREDIQEGFENAPATLMRLFTGANFGKQLLMVS